MCNCKYKKDATKVLTKSGNLLTVKMSTNTSTSANLKLSPKSGTPDGKTLPMLTALHISSTESDGQNQTIMKK